jgi:hypothetical protein
MPLLVGLACYPSGICELECVADVGDVTVELAKVPDQLVFSHTGGRPDPVAVACEQTL